MSKQTIKGYSYDEKEDEIGRGALGTIFRAQHIEDPSNEVAIKVIDHSKGPAKRMPKELKERELEICKAILNERHENLVSLKDYEVKLSTTHLIMEFCSGGDFRGYLEDKKTLSESVIQQFFRQIVSGLKFLHDRNIVHRDLKPENILLSFTGEVVTGIRYPTPENIILKIADFGASRFLSSDAVALTTCGTLVYMAPEILERKPYSKEVDVWSIGVMVYEYLSGKIPKPPYDNSELPEKTSKEMRELLQKLMAHEPQDRLNCEQILDHKFMRASELSREAAAPPSTPTDEDSQSDGSKLEQHSGINLSMEGCFISSGCTVTLVNREKSVREYNYDEESELGVGSFGTVYLGWHSMNRNWKVAIKVMNLRNSTVKRIPQKILDREAKILQDLSATSHCHLVKLLHLQRTDSKLFFIMEYCNGGNLRKYLNVNGVLRPSVIRLFFLQIAKGTKFLHDRDIIHRNLKPENILLNFDGEPYPRPEIIIIKIGDFGLERYLPEDGIVTTHCGTPEYYRAPEIKPGAQYDKKVDLWSIGMMIYECLVGSRIAKDLKDIMRGHKHWLLPNAIKDIRDVVLGNLLVSQSNSRIDIDQLLVHRFMREDMFVYVRGCGASAKAIITVKKSCFVEELIEKIRNQFNITSEDMRYVLSEFPDLEQYCGSNLSLEDCGIKSGCTVTLLLRLH